MSRPHIAELSVKDLALVSELRLELAPGLTVLTGETGAGKSMLVDALLAATGGRVAAGMVRDGAERAKVEAVFAGVGNADLILGREIQPGRAPARMNGETVPLAKLAETGSELVAIHGQGDQLRLARPAVQRDLLDAYGGHGRLCDAVSVAHRTLRGIRAERESLGGDPRERARRLALLEHEVNEIDAARVGPQEEETLAADLTVARSAEKLRASATSVYDLLVGERAAARDRLAVAARELAAAAELDPRLADQATRLAASVDEVEDLGADLRRYADTIDAEPRELARLEARNDALAELKRKYGPSLDDVIAYVDRARRALVDVSSQEERLARLDAEERSTSDALRAASATLHTAREKSARKLAKSVEAELADLGLGRCRFAVAIEPIEPDASGADRVTFQIAPNPGEPFAPLQEIASGGELSRIMLAIEVVLAAQDQTPVLVFDEVDAGVGGRLGEVVGRALWSLAREHQVLCVSHLAQVAAYADAHVKVRKEVRGGRTHVVADRLDGRASVSELAEMLGAGGSSRSLAAGARELQSGAADWKATERRGPRAR
jgi:DNA repair protein RecN (Recombination protein N)